MAFEEFKKVANSFNELSAQQKEKALTDCSSAKFTSAHAIKHYHDSLLFTLAYPENETIRNLAASEMKRLSVFIKSAKQDVKDKLILSGIANTQTDGAFSLSLAKWLLKEYGKDVQLHSFDESGTHPKEVLKYLFPEMEFEMLADEKMKAGKWIEKLSGTKSKHEQLQWLVNHVDSIKVPDLVKDQLFESLSVYITVIGRDEKFSRSFGNIQLTKTFYHSNGILKKFDEASIIKKKLPAPSKLSNAQRKQIIDASRTALALLNRETDPVTYCNEEGLLFFELEHGLSIALFSMLPQRRLPLESYIGFMMFKNGYPMAYGGGWLFGHRSLLGINIFEAFRGGESAFVFAQLLRTYKNAFGAEYFEVEPYQFGKNNPEGLQSGAFWFYYRFGFRPLDAELNELALKEAAIIAAQKGYRSSIETLKKFTAGNVFVNFSHLKKPLNPSLMSKYISQRIASDYNGNRMKAEAEARKAIIKTLKLSPGFVKSNTTGMNKLVMFFYMCTHLNSLSGEQKLLIKKLIEQKSDSEFDYINTLSKMNLNKMLSADCLKFISC